MKTDVIGKVDKIKLPTSKALFPLFEAVVNSFQAIEELSQQKNTYINLIIQRDDSQTTLTNEDSPIKSVIIEDNGIGFTDIHYNSFQTSDSTLKKLKGGKGIGRFLWLKTYEKVIINSTYKEKNNFYNRKFEFLLQNEDITNGKSEPIKVKENKTIIKLENFKNDYKQVCPKQLDKIANRIIEHCLLYFLASNCPTVTLKDEKTEINLNDEFLKYIRDRSEPEEFTIKEQQFKIWHLKLYDSIEKDHRFYYCANNREVKNEKIEKFIPDLGKRIKEVNGKSFTYFAYVFGNYLDNNVNNERTDFDFFDETDNEVIPYVVKRTEINDKIIEKIKDYLKDYLNVIKIQKKEQIKDYINNEAPQYRFLFNHKEDEILEKIPPNLSKDKLDIKLYELKTQTYIEARKDVQEVLNIEHTEMSDEYSAKLEQGINLINESSKSDLINYIVHRRIILDIFEQNLKRDNQNKYSLEKAIHNLIFPLKHTSDNIDFEKQNLWIIDEKLAYHSYLASDMELNKIANTESEQRPDIILFNNCHAFINEGIQPYNSVVIIEFKKPMRNDYSSTKDPIYQILDYIDVILDGNAKDKDGRPIKISENTAFFLYLICDITPTLEKLLSREASIVKTPDGLGYFWFHQRKKAYIEVISYNKLLQDAKKRNQILFDKLNIK